MTTQPSSSSTPTPDINPFIEAAQALISSIELCHKQGIDEGIRKDVWIAGIETLRIVAVTQTLSSLSDSRRYPDSSLRGALTAMLTRSINKTEAQIRKYQLLLSTVLPRINDC